MGLTENLPVIGKKKKQQQLQSGQPSSLLPQRPGGNGNGTFSPEQMKQLGEFVTQTVDKANARWQTSRMSEEQRLEFAKLVYHSDRPMMRRMTWRSHFRSQVDAWLYTLSYIANPDRYKEEGWGEAVLDEDGNEIGWTRKPGDLLPFLLNMEEQIWQSDEGLLIKATTTGMMSQLDFDQTVKMESYGSRGR